MKELVIGADGYIGARLCRLSGAEGTSHRNPVYSHHHHYDLADGKSKLPEASVYYLCAGINGMEACEGKRMAWQVNVDHTLQFVRAVTPGAFVVWISSTTVEWSGSAYARQKAHVEGVLWGHPNVAIVRAGRVIDQNLDDLCNTLIKVGRQQIPGLTVWGRDEPPYQRK